MHSVFGTDSSRREVSNKTMRLRRSAIAALALFGVATASPLSATVITGSSGAYSVYADINLTLSGEIGGLLPLATDALLQVNLGKLADAEGTAPAPYNNNDALTALHESAAGTVLTSITLDTVGTDDLITVNAQSDVNGGAGSRSSSAEAAVNNLVLSVALDTGLPLIGSLDLLRIDAGSGTIESSSGVSGDYGALSGSGGSIIENATVDLLGLIAGLDVTANAGTPANTQLSPLPGLISILVNEQTSSGNGVDSMTFATNALHVDLLTGVALSFDFGTQLLPNVLEIGTLTGEIIVSHSEAALTAEASGVPAPATLLLVSGGLLGLVRMRDRRSSV